MIRYFQNPLPKSKHVDEKVSNSTSIGFAVPENDPAPLPSPSSPLTYSLQFTLNSTLKQFLPVKKREFHSQIPIPDY